MGAGASTTTAAVDQPETVITEPTNEDLRRTAADEPEKTMSGKRKNRGIFEKTSTIINLNRDFGAVLAEKLGDEAWSMDAQTEKLIKECLQGFFFSDDSNSRLNIVMKAMKKEVVEAGADIIKEGDPGNKLYIISDGSAEVRIKSEFIRNLHSGAIFGELALLYDAPRSATVTCLETCVLWTLERDIFKYTQAFTASAQATQRTRWLTQSPALAKLTPLDLSRLIASMPQVTYASGTTIVNIGDLNEKVLVIEKGSAAIYVPQDTQTFASEIECDDKLQIVRPHHRMRISINDMDISQISQFVRGQQVKGLENISDAQEYLSMGEPIHENEGVSMQKVCEVYEGCILGMGSLMPKEDGLWRKAPGAGAFSPYMVVANSTLEGSTFGVEMFQRTIGSIESILQGEHSYRSMNSVVTSAEQEHSLRNIQLEAAMFTPLHILGAGCFGTIVEAEYHDAQKAEHDGRMETYALKYLSKSKAVSNLKQVIKERDLLKECNSAFVMYYHGCFQTNDDLVLVSDVINGPDLYTIVNESQYQSKGIPFNMARFFAAGILFGLSHIHERGIVFRDLKPENVMIDSSGYVRLIDFGFASKVPYIKVDPATGESVVHAKLYTLCGTPEYFAPELLFNLGHDQSADIWSFAVMVHEFLVGFTPFCGTDSNDITQLFKNIALVQKKGLQLSKKLDSIESSDKSKDFLRKLLRANPAERLGVQEAATSFILEHEFFKDLDFKKMFARDLPAPFIPTPIDPKERKQLSLMQESKPYEGNQALFSEF